MRKLAAAILALPVIGILYVSVLLRRSIAARIGLAVGVGSLIGMAALSALATPGQARPPSRIVPVAETRFSAILELGHAPNLPIVIDFSQPMNRASVAEALTVAPSTGVRLSWNADGRELTVRPATLWVPATYYAITVGTGARDEAGAALGKPVRALFLTQAAAQGRIAAATTTGDRVPVSTAFRLVFDRPVLVNSAKVAFQIEPAVNGVLAPDAGGAASAGFTFTAATPLRADTTYTITLASLVVDEDGLPIGGVDPLTVRTVAAPSVVRFRPLAGTTGVATDALLSVRFTRAMDESSTAAAFTVRAGTTAVKGKTSWAEGDTVLVFDPSASLPYGTKVTMTVAATARARDGAALDAAHSATFTTLAKPVAARTTTTRGTSTVIPTGGATAGGAPWYAVETYYLRLMNCTRTGGWVYTGGRCGAVPAGRTVRPPAAALALDAGISSRVSRPYAKIIATAGVCDHFYGSTPKARLDAAGYTSGNWGENVGCPSGDPYVGMVAVEIFFQNEAPYPAGLNHYTNLMDPTFHRAGVGVWVYAGRVRVVIDFNP